MPVIFPFRYQVFRLMRFLMVYFTVAVVCGCSPARKPVPAGAIPASRPPTITEEQYGHEVLAALTKRWQLDYGHPRANAVDNIVQRLAKAAKADQEPWHVYILKDDNFKNAAATRGNHVFVWTGMINTAKSDNELAAVLSHEMSHVLARHTDPDPNEDLRKFMVQLGAIAAGVAASYATRGGMFSRTAGDLASAATKEVGSGILVNPYSRENEFEADRIGFFLMADAKFSPQAAVDFWARAEGDPDFGSSLAFFSTHPPAGERLEELKKLLPQAMARFDGRAQAPQFYPQIEPRPAQLPQSGTTHAAGAAAPAQPGGFDPATDSFDVGKAPAQADYQPSPQQYPPAQNTPPEAPDDTSRDFIVIAPKAVLYSQPSAKSKPIGEFKHGAVVRVKAEHGDWLEIDRPDHGFVARHRLLPDDEHQLD